MRARNPRALLAAAAIAALTAAGSVAAQDRDRDRVRDPAAAQDRVEQSTQERDRDRVADRDRLLDRDQDRLTDRDRDRDQDRDRDRDRDRLHVEDRDQLRDRDIYGSALMSDAERAQYRARLNDVATDQEWVRFRAEHQARMTARARERNVGLDAPLYGQELMTDRECAQLRERLEKAANEQAREQIRAEHRTRMQERARDLGVSVAEGA